MSQSLLITVRFHENRYHGQQDGFDESFGWPPSPARLFQALVSGAAQGAQLRSEDQRALRWMEKLDPPRIAAPAIRRGQSVRIFVPNNDIDAVGGDPAYVSKIRVGKQWRPCFFDIHEPILYVWDFESGAEEASQICNIAERLYQLGRTIDIAWAEGQILNREQARKTLEICSSAIRKPQGGGTTAVPHSGTLDSLITRHRHKLKRLETVVENRKARQLFSQPPRASFGLTGYDTPAQWLHFELRTRSGSFAPRPLDSAASLITGLRNAAADRLGEALPNKKALFERIIIGRGAGSADLDQRIRLLPIPSIGTRHTDPSIRRIAIEIPANCPVRIDDLQWAFTGVQPFDPDTGRVWPGCLASTEDARMADRFMQRCKLFRSITPVAMPAAPRRRLGENCEEKRGAERYREERTAVAAVIQSLRHTGIRIRPTDILVQRESFQQRGVRAEKFAKGSRFSKHTLWHAEIRFAESIAGPLVIGDGRFCGLGLFEPIAEHIDIVTFRLGATRINTRQDQEALIRYLRRALMSLARNNAGQVGRLFSGHEPNGAPARSTNVHEHVFLAVDDSGEGGKINRLVVAAPWICDRQSKERIINRRLFNQVTGNLKELRAGYLGRFDNLVATPVEDGDPLIGPSRCWISKSPYVATRNLKKREDIASIIKADVITECARRSLPKPTEIEILTSTAGPHGGLPTAKIKIQFAVAVRGPFMLGRNSHAGGGLFHTLQGCQ